MVNQNDKTDGNGKIGAVGSVRELKADANKDRAPGHGRGAIVLASAIAASTLAGCEYNYYGNEDVATNPPACSVVQVTDRCSGDTPDKTRCMVYEGSAADFDGYLFKIADVREVGGVKKVYVDVMEKSLDCQVLYAFELTAGVEHGFSVGTVSYTLLPRWVEISADSDAPAVVELEIRRVSVEPAEPVCPEVTDRCEGGPSATACTVYLDRAVELNGVLFTVTDISEEGGVKRVVINISDRELGCRILQTYVLNELDSADVIVEGRSYSIFVVGLHLEGDASWAFLQITGQVDSTTCSATPVSERCIRGADDSVRCEVRAGAGLELNGMLFQVEAIAEDGVQVRIYDKLLGCENVDNVIVSAPGTLTSVIGSYVYTITIFGANLDDQSVDMQVERRALLCDGTETRGVLNVGELMAAGTGLKVRLDDITRESGTDNQHKAILTILDMADNEFMHMTIGEGEARLINYGGRTHVVSVNEVAAGVMLIAKWADVSVQVCE